MLFTSYSQHVDTPLCIHQHGAPHANLASTSLLWYHWQSYVYFSKYAKQIERKFYKVICWLSHKGNCRPKAQLLITPSYNEPVASLLSLFIKKRQREERTEETCESPQTRCNCHSYHILLSQTRSLLRFVTGTLLVQCNCCFADKCALAYFSTKPFASLKAASKNHLRYISWPYTPRFRILLNATYRTMPLKAQDKDDRLSPNRQWKS